MQSRSHIEFSCPTHNSSGLLKLYMIFPAPSRPHSLLHINQNDGTKQLHCARTAIQQSFITVILNHGCRSLLDHFVLTKFNSHPIPPCWHCSHSCLSSCTGKDHGNDVGQVQTIKFWERELWSVHWWLLWSSFCLALEVFWQHGLVTSSP